jgi:hypothetical protein
MMAASAPISHHLDLYRYWCEKRGDRTMPARSELEAGDIYTLLPFLSILEKVEGQFRYRLHGSAAAKEIGRDLTGGFVGSYVNAPESAAAMRAVCERVFATAHPVFSTGEFKIRPGCVHNMSVLLLPLSDDGVTVNMAISTLVARFNFNVEASTDWLEGIPIKVRDVVDIEDAAKLEEICLEWNRRCSVGERDRVTP